MHYRLRLISRYYEIYQWTNNFGIASNVSKSSIDYI
jgi:hypothetical protein